MAVKVYSPKIQIRLLKIIRRGEVVPGLKTAARYDRLTEIDLTPYLGEWGGVKIAKSIRAPAGGFALTFADQAHPEYFETLAALIEPMDLVEIRMAHDPADYAKPESGYQLPIVLRGFVSEVRRDESMGQDQRPSRRVIVSGQDYGKIWSMFQIVYLNNSVVGDNILSTFRFLQKYGVDVDKNPSVSDFVGDVSQKILTPLLANMKWWGKPLAREFSRLPARVTAQGKVSGPLVNAWPGGRGIYYLLAHVCDVDSGFNELFVDDEPDGPVIVLRPTPWRDPKGRYIQDGASAEIIEIGQDDLISISVTRTDQGVANVFWVQNPSFIYLSDVFMQLATGLMRPVDDNPNCDPRSYGVRVMREEVSLGAPDWAAGYADSLGNQTQRAPSETQWLEKRRDTLEKASGDSVLFERGSIRVRGNERIRAGRFLRIIRGETSAEYYVSQVDHDFVPYQMFVTTCQVERGTGFIERSQRQAAPYFAELTGVGI